MTRERFRARSPRRRRWIALAVLTSIIGLVQGARADWQAGTPAQLERAGWDAVRANRLVEAAGHFREGLRREPGNIRLLLGAGLAAHLLGRDDEARLHLTAALQANPALTEASILLGQLLYRGGDLPGAIHVYEQALAHAPKAELLTARLALWRREVELHDRFAQRFGHRFTVLFEGPNEEAIATRTLDLLDAAYWRIGTALGAYPPEVVTVVLYTNEQFRDITRSPAWAAAAFDGRIRLPIRGALENPRELERILAHEFAHALVYSLAPRGVPQWLNEGLAQFFEPGAPSRPSSGTPGAPRLELKQLEGPFHGLDRGRARVAYAQSLDAVAALVGDTGLTSIANLLAYLGQGQPFAEAFERATFIRYEEFARRWRDR